MSRALARAVGLLLLASSVGVASVGRPESCTAGACHVAIQKQLKKGRVVHEPAGGGDCAACHEPHVNGRPGKVRQPIAQGCSACHDTWSSLSGATGAMHRPVTEGRCPACHEPHAGERPGLLVSPFPAAPPSGFQASDYALCWGCHDRGGFIASGGGKGTSFRNGAVNLHVTHLQRAKGATCATCHELHAPAAFRLLRTRREGPGFASSPGGGSCVPPCHGAKRYERGALRKR